jgi:hypothetical protein
MSTPLVNQLIARGVPPHISRPIFWTMYKRPKATSKEFPSKAAGEGALFLRAVNTVLWIRKPIPRKKGAMIAIEISGLISTLTKNVKVSQAAIIMNSPWERLSTRATPYWMLKPMAARAYTPPFRIPDTITQTTVSLLIALTFYTVQSHRSRLPRETYLRYDSSLSIF